MNNSIKDAFNSIHAQESLKDKTKVYVKHTLHRRHKRRFTICDGRSTCIDSLFSDWRIQGVLYTGCSTEFRYGFFH